MMDEEKEMIVVRDTNGVELKVELITFLINDDHTMCYLVYSKGEKTGADDDEVIYISRVIKNNDSIQLLEIVDDDEWISVQQLLKKIANV